MGGIRVEEFMAPSHITDLPTTEKDKSSSWCKQTSPESTFLYVPLRPIHPPSHGHLHFTAALDIRP